MKAVAIKTDKKMIPKEEKEGGIASIEDQIVMVMFPSDTWRLVCEIAENEEESPAGIISRAIDLYSRRDLD